MPSTAYSLKPAGGSEYVYKAVYGSYTGYRYENQELTVQKLLGKDPALTDKNEVLQSTGLGAKTASLDIYATGSTERDNFLGLLWKTCTHNDGTGDGDHNAVVMSVNLKMYNKVGGGTATWVVTISLREV